MTHSSSDSSGRDDRPRPDRQILRGPVTVMFALTLAVAAESAEKPRHLPLPPWGFSLIALGIFFVLFAITWSFRSIGNRH